MLSLQDQTRINISRTSQRFTITSITTMPFEQTLSAASLAAALLVGILSILLYFVSSRKKRVKVEEESLLGGLEELYFSGECENSGDGVRNDEGADDEDLFKLPPKEECPVCLLPMPNESSYIGYVSCCGNVICAGCDIKESAIRLWTNEKREAKNPPLPRIEATCPLCRTERVITDKLHYRRLRKRMDLNDNKAFYKMGSNYEAGAIGLPKDLDKAIEHFLRAVELGSANACWSLALLYLKGEVKLKSWLENPSKKIPPTFHYFKLAAMRGHIAARYNIGVQAFQEGNVEVAMKHWMISAAAGNDDSLQQIRESYRIKKASKDHFEEALRAYQKAKEDMASEERDMAKKFVEGGRDWLVFSQKELAKLCGVRDNELISFSEFYAAIRQ